MFLILKGLWKHMGKKPKFKGIVIVLLLVYLSYIFVNLEVSMQKKKSELAKKQQEVVELKKENTRLKDDVKLSSSDLYIEKMAREKCGLIKEGETPVIDNK